MTSITEDNIRSMAGIISRSFRSGATAQIYCRKFAANFAVLCVHCMKPKPKIENCFH